MSVEKQRAFRNKQTKKSNFSNHLLTENYVSKSTTIYSTVSLIQEPMGITLSVSISPTFSHAKIKSEHMQTGSTEKGSRKYRRCFYVNYSKSKVMSFTRKVYSFRLVFLYFKCKKKGRLDD